MTLGSEIVLALSTAVTGAVLAHFLYSFEKFKRETGPRVRVQMALSVVACLCCYVVSCAAWLSFSAVQRTHNDMNPNVCYAYWEIGPCFYMLGRTGNALFFALRLYHSFRNSAMAYSRQFTTRLCAAILALGIVQCLLFQLALFGSSKMHNLSVKYRDDYQINNFEDCVELRKDQMPHSFLVFFSIAVAFFLITDFIISVLLLRLFVRNLLLLNERFQGKGVEITGTEPNTIRSLKSTNGSKAVSLDTTTEIQRVVSSSIDETKKDESDGIHALIKRTTTLVVVTVMSTWLLVFAGYGSLQGTVGALSMPVDAAVNSVCLFFQFSFSDAIYNVTCARCNQLCFDHCINTCLCRCFLLDCCECRYLTADSRTQVTSASPRSVTLKPLEL